MQNFINIYLTPVWPEQSIKDIPNSIRVSLFSMKKSYLKKTHEILSKKLCDNPPEFLFSVYYNHDIQCVKSVHIPSCSGSYFPASGLNTDQNNSEYGHFLHSAMCNLLNLNYTNICPFSLRRNHLKVSEVYFFKINVWMEFINIARTLQHPKIFKSVSKSVSLTPPFLLSFSISISLSTI